MPKIVKNGKEYSGVPIECVTAWQPTGDPVQVAEPLMGNTDISEIGDGTITGAISAVDAGLTFESTYYSYAGGTIYFKRIGNVKTMYLQIDPPSAISTGTTWFTLPEQFRPILANGNDIMDFTCVQTSGTFSGILRLNGNTGRVTSEFIPFKAGAVRSSFTYI